ncbi:hypothetical protein A2767_04285 [Candidatus Roizmanbacteria bacterium RIFCSPHIGHO2_01_FULL_35_10]|uniref:Type II secretion system protein GspG C-terminal domain-containing protein n=1 Tax=Candidatus Roizmanbacteria bacterium RIFCSPLOWO2_01_FULL_35_13 TaxID=1802055 RepID=A0A1F7I8F5_9BACT|nr:MAG: hypothetical protein A2767_04285 [Candidatus Roizmanbacteria bacterium RIFCSPHIGHO2_01_FULL_35_10]OGK39647.1 MAG: hypothetical protein A3A74_07730 [Candidatus Roizmanbacteria bacterium RIFCSPLOWO2_01_FULL_35_13]
MTKSFTLIELLIVITIIGILATLGISSYFNSLKAAKDARRKSDLSTIQKALEVYYQDNQGYPLSLPNNGDPFCHSSGDCWMATYLQKTPFDPNGSAYSYDSDGTYYKLYSCIENPNDSGPGVDQNGYGLDCSGNNTQPCDPCRYAVTSTNTTP